MDIGIAIVSFLLVAALGIGLLMAINKELWKREKKRVRKAIGSRPIPDVVGYGRRGRGVAITFLRRKIQEADHGFLEDPDCGLERHLNFYLAEVGTFAVLSEYMVEQFGFCPDQENFLGSFDDLKGEGHNGEPDTRGYLTLVPAEETEIS